MESHRLEWLVGCFMILGIIALLILSLKVSGLTGLPDGQIYQIHAEFTDIGDLKVRAPVTIAGVVIGRVSRITLNTQNFKALVTLNIDKHNQTIPVDSTANIYTAGLIGSNYISIIPGFEDACLKSGDMIKNTNPAMILQNIVGQLMFSLNHKDTKGSSR